MVGAGQVAGRPRTDPAGRRHALWDPWVHERDILLSLGRAPVVDADEVRCRLRYCASLWPAFVLTGGGVPDGPAVVEVTDPSDRFVVEPDGDQVRVHDGPVPDGAPVLRGDAVTILEQLSIRDAGLPPSEALTRLTAGLATVFDRPSVA